MTGKTNGLRQPFALWRACFALGFVWLCVQTVNADDYSVGALRQEPETSR